MRARRILQAGLLVCGLTMLLAGAAVQGQNAGENNIKPIVVDTKLYAGVMADVRNTEVAYVQENQEQLVMAAMEDRLTEENVYSFLQGPRSWENEVPWSGEWCYKYVRGNYFGGFGCGHCCMANIYSTLTDYTCSPLDMFTYATTVSGYYPSKESGAIGWGDMKVTLQKSGFTCDVYRKPSSYEEFQSQIAAAESAIVLVSSHNDDTFWENTGGHYVNIWLYREDTDEVFLAEPGSPTNNRSWIPLRYVYDALKTVSQYQYLLVDGYDEEANLWKHDGIVEQWTAP